jgi:hypothetical protein
LELLFRLRPTTKVRQENVDDDHALRYFSSVSFAIINPASGKGLSILSAVLVYWLVFYRSARCASIIGIFIELNACIDLILIFPIAKSVSYNPYVDFIRRSLGPIKLIHSVAYDLLLAALDLLRTPAKSLSAVSNSGHASARLGIVEGIFRLLRFPSAREMAVESTFRRIAKSIRFSFNRISANEGRQWRSSFGDVHSKMMTVPTESIGDFTKNATVVSKWPMSIP